MLATPRTFVAAVIVVLIAAGTAQAQTTAPCHQSPCALIVDWGVGKSAIDMPPDRKYGAVLDFEAGLKEALQSHEMLAATNVPDSKISIRIQAKYETRVLCEDMPGTMPDRSCATIGEAVANFATSEVGAKLPTSLRTINHCGASGAKMTMLQFGKHTGEMIWYTLEGEQKKASKPMGRC